MFRRFTLRTVPTRLPDRNEDHVPRECAVGLRRMLDRSPVALVAATVPINTLVGKGDGQGSHQRDHEHASDEHCHQHDVSESALAAAAGSSASAEVLSSYVASVSGGKVVRDNDGGGPAVVAVGKTAIAIEYAWNALEKRVYSVVRWFDCGVDSSLECQFRALAAEMDIECGADVDLGDVINAVHARFSTLDVRSSPSCLQTYLAISCPLGSLAWVSHTHTHTHSHTHTHPYTHALPVLCLCNCNP